MAVRDIIQLGNPQLYRRAESATEEDLPRLREIVDDLHDTMMEFRRKFGFGQGIAAPQIGVFKRMIYIHIDSPLVFINPVLDDRSDEMIEIWDNCMSFPDLLVRLRRHKTCTVNYYDLDWQWRSMALEGELSELLQHECDHLDGILAVSRAIDGHAFALRTQMQ